MHASYMHEHGAGLGDPGSDGSGGSRGPGSGGSGGQRGGLRPFAVTAKNALFVAKSFPWAVSVPPVFTSIQNYNLRNIS